MVCDNNSPSIGSGPKTILQDEVVISGISGRFPECDTIEEFQQKLFSGIDLVKDNNSRWPKDYLETYSSMGFMKDLRNFDAPFFGAHPKLAERTDPIVRTLLETSFEAVLDAGQCPTALRGSETGVVVVVSSNEAADWWSADPDRVNGYEFLGCTRTMYSNRISFSMDLRGPSYTMDSQSSSGLLGIQQAYHMLKCGMVDGVIVAGVNLVLNPHFNVMFKKLNMLSPSGKCKTFDADADGYARSEAAVAVYLQRASDAHRVYGYVAAVDANCDGYKEDGCDAISRSSQIELYQHAYQSFNLDPQQVSFVEAHGYSTVHGDKEELNGIASVFCPNDADERQQLQQRRREPLLVGSVKSNVGCSEPVGGLVSVIKTLLAMENGILPPNLHFKTPNPKVPALKDGRLRIVDKLTVWNGEYAAINSFGIGGTNAHLVLKRNLKEKTLDGDKITLPRIVAVSGRTEQTVRDLLDQIENVHSDNELCALINNIFSQHIQHYNYRAFSVFGRETITEVSTYIAGQEEKRPICFIFSGMGSQWAGMCRDLLQTPVFRQTIDECSRVLEKVQFDLYAVLSSNDSNVYSNVLNSFVGITCTQIALVNILRLLNIEPDLMIGHSIGELACAYADDTLSLEQTVLATYWRGKSLLMSNIAPGAMAAIGLSYDDIRSQLPGDISVACHNSADNVTISGPLVSINSFVEKLQSQGIFARQVNSSGYAFHSQYIAEAAAIFKPQLEKIITNAKPRSKRWISTSIPDSMWNTPSAQYSSVEYHLNNLLSPVYFNKALTYVPDNAVVIEVAPHALLQSILKGSLNSKCSHIGLLRRNQSTITDLLTNIGRLYNAGLQPKFSNLYPSISFPVSRKTPMIQSMIKWDHSTKWFLVSFLTKPACGHGEVEVDVDVGKAEYKYLTKCVYDDCATFPVAAYLCLIWEAVAKMKYSRVYDVPLVIENFQLIAKRTLSKKEPLKFVVNLLEQSGSCEIRENGQVVARAIVKSPNNIDEEFVSAQLASTTSSSSSIRSDNSYLPLKSSDIYQDLHAKGYSYSKEFKQLLYVDNNGENGKIAWSNNWITFVEAMLQLHLLGIDKQQHYAIDHIQRIVLDAKKHEQEMQQNGNVSNKSGVGVKFSPSANIIVSGGIEISGVKSTLVSVRSNKHREQPIILHSTFVPHFSNKIFTPSEAVSMCTQLAFENISCVEQDVVDIAEIVTGSGERFASPHILQTAKIEPYVVPQITLYDARNNGNKVQDLEEKLSNSTTSSDNVTIAPVSEQNGINGILRESSKRYNLIVCPSECYYEANNSSDHHKNSSGVVNETLQSLWNALTDDGFLVVFEDKNTASQINSSGDLSSFQFRSIAKFQTPVGTYTLLRKTPKWKTCMVIAFRNELNWIDSVKVAIRKHQIDGRNTMLVYQGEDITGLIGFMKSIRREPWGRGLKCLYTDDSIHPYAIVDLAYIDYLRNGLIFNVHQKGEWGSYRNFQIHQSAMVECEHAFIGARQVGDFSSLAYIESRIPLIDSYRQLGHLDTLVHCYFVPLYPHRDVSTALGLLAADEDDDNNYNNYHKNRILAFKQGAVLGHEYSGRDSKGRRVFGMVGGGALATTVLADKTVMWNVPDNWSLEQAATIPRIYAVAYYALVIRANLQRGESIYINAGIMGLCMSCAHVAIGLGAQVFIGFNNRDEKKYLRDTFPKLADSSFIDLEESSFDSQLLERTNYKGVDVIFDTLNCHKRNLFVDSLAFNGRLVEFEKGSAFDENAGHTALEKNITFHKVSHKTLWVGDVGLQDRKRIHQLVDDGIKSGVVKPLATVVFSDSQICEAFRVAQSGKFVGKIIIKVRDEESRSTLIPKTKLVKAYPSAFLNPLNSYIVTGGLTDFGIQIVNWLVSRGATKIVLLSQYRPVTGHQCLALRRWQKASVDVTLCNVDAASPIGAEILVEKANKLAPVAGIFHAAYIECDRAFAECSRGQFDLLWKTKAEIAKNLDQASRKLCPNLKYFVGFSDIDALYGTNGKTASAYANSAMEVIYKKRKMENLPATIIRRGPIEKSYSAESSNSNNNFVAIKTDSLFRNMPDLLNQPFEMLSVYNVDKTLQNSPTSVAEEQEELVEEIAELMGVRDPEVLYSTKFRDIGLDTVIKNEIEAALNKYGVKSLPEEIGQLSFSKVSTLLEKGK
ncbi:fatty acid synthase-like isoform X2 [Planococcus citri]|uniref:fatty acid synthase-like isoform X2 n=1 Tax=Planococcus citri TaxID=170843 RepID=UPI0031F75851